MRKSWSPLFLAVVSAAIVASFALDAGAQARGYQARPCGFDLDGDGVRGEPVDDCRICDGATSDPDGDGVDEDMIYVDCNGGSDTGGCGQPGNPCGSIGHAFSIADGPGDGAEDIICFRGTCDDVLEQDLTRSGVPGHYELAPRGSQQYAFQYPQNPAMLVGWDFDGDGCYPPFDNGSRGTVTTAQGTFDCGSDADEAVLDGSDLNKRKVFVNTDDTQSYVEMAHFSVNDYSYLPLSQTGQSGTPDDGGFIKVCKNNDCSHLYFHDLSMSNMLRNSCAGSNTIVFDMFTGGARMSYLAIENIELPNRGGYLSRGSVSANSGDGPDHHIRIQNVSESYMPASHPNCENWGLSESPKRESSHTLKWWGWGDYIEFIDNYTNAQPLLWNAQASGHYPSTAVIVGQCTQHWMIRNNLFVDNDHAFAIQSKDDISCTNRRVADVTFDGNRYVQYEAPWLNDSLVTLDSANGAAGSATQIFEDVRITNNTFYMSPGAHNAGFIHVGASANACPGGDWPGVIEISHNTFYGSTAGDRDVDPTNGYRGHGGTGRGGAIQFGHVDRSPGPCTPNHIVLTHNVFDGNVGPDEKAIHAKYDIPDFHAEGNIFDTDTFVWNGGTHDFAWWQSNVSAGGSKQTPNDCDIAYLDEANGDLRFADDDTCANGSGANNGPPTVPGEDGGVNVPDAGPGTGSDAGTDGGGFGSDSGAGPGRPRQNRFEGDTLHGSCATAFQPDGSAGSTWLLLGWFVLVWRRLRARI